MENSSTSWSPLACWCWTRLNTYSMALEIKPYSERHGQPVIVQDLPRLDRTWSRSTSGPSLTYPIRSVRRRKPFPSSRTMWRRRLMIERNHGRYLLCVGVRHRSHRNGIDDWFSVDISSDWVISWDIGLFSAPQTGCRHISLSDSVAPWHWTDGNAPRLWRFPTDVKA